MNILDILTIIVIIVFAATGYKKGILKNVISVVGTVVASLMSSVLSKPIAEAIYNGGFKSAIAKKTESAMKLAQQEGTDFIDNLLKTLPNYVGNSLKGFGLSPADLASAAARSGSAQVERVLSPIVISFISVIVSVILFTALLIIVKIICGMICRSMDDAANVFDGFIGAVVAMIEGFAVIMLAAFVLRISIPHMGKVPDVISNESISESIVFKGIYNSPILTGLVEAVTDSPNTDIVE